ncbi:MAG TPA: hypothetical protein DD420_15470, partial [Streptomyces sp.]|nr:hypothetical protein [Streptomyces sp.]
MDEGGRAFGGGAGVRGARGLFRESRLSGDVGHPSPRALSARGPIDVVGLARIRPVSGRPSAVRPALRSHAPDAVGPALRADG